MTKSVANLTPDDFEARGGEAFHVEAEGKKFELKLIAVRRLGQALREGGAFSLLFAAPDGPILPQAIYPLTHAALGTIELFMVPLGPKGGANQYEVVFT